MPVLPKMYFPFFLAFFSLCTLPMSQAHCSVHTHFISSVEIGARCQDNVMSARMCRSNVINIRPIAEERCRTWKKLPLVAAGNGSEIGILNLSAIVKGKPICKFAILCKYVVHTCTVWQELAFFDHTTILL